MVYIDNFNAKYRGMIMCHMIADTREELLCMVDSIGVHRKWIQDRNTPREHFDICLAKKAKALKLGAVEIGFRELAEKTRTRIYEGVQQVY
jgi:hypothetical protein